MNKCSQLLNTLLGKESMHFSQSDLCNPSTPCQIDTPHGTVKGKACALGDEINRLVTLYNLKELKEKGFILPSEETRVASFSSCPNQVYGGTVRLVFDKANIGTKMRPMCYYEQDSESEKIFDKVEQEEKQKLRDEGKLADPDLVRARYGASMNLYSNECEYFSKDPISLESLKRIEYWIGGAKTGSFSTGCEKRYPHEAGLYSDPDNYIVEIQKTKEIAENLKVPFEVNSCFNKLKAGWDSAIELNDENLSLMKEGNMYQDLEKLGKILPSEQVEETCKC